MIIQKIKKQHIVQSLRFDGSYHLSEGTLYLRKLRKMPYQELQNLCSRIFTAGRSKRIYTEKDKGFPYLSNSDVVRSMPLEGCKYNSKKYAYDEPSFLKEGMIVTGRVGAIGQTAYITSELEENQAMGSDNIIRIVCKDKSISGYVYSFLTSKYGNTLLNKLATGGVQPYISEDMLQDMPIPMLSAEKQQKIHQLIVEASELRVEANALLRNAITSIESDYHFKSAPKTFQVNISDIKKGDKYTNENRLEADYYLPNKIFLESQIKSKTHALLGDLCNSVTISNLRARTFVKEGITLFTGQSLGLLKPDLSKQLSKALTRNIEENITENGDVLVTAFGTLGKTEYCYNNFYTGVFASQQIARIRVNKSKIDEGYLSVFLKCKVGQELIQKFKTGSVIEWANWNNFCSILVPIPDDRGREIGETARIVARKFNKAYELERQAIALIEKEIDLWQVS